MAEVVHPEVEVYTEPRAVGGVPRRYALQPNDILPIVKSRKHEEEAPYVILGFDTEFEGPGFPVTREHIKEGKARYTVVSYQFHAATSDGREWNGICCPHDDERMSIAEFLTFALAVGARNYGITRIPAAIILAGHFTRADMPAFSDFRDQIDFLTSLRSTIVTVDATKVYSIQFPDASTTDLHVRIRDTMLLTPQMSKSLAKIGELVGVPKLQLDDDPKVHDQLIRRMKYVRDHHWDRFRPYALNDAKVCVRYLQRIKDQYKSVSGKSKVPITLTSIGVDLLEKCWKEGFGDAALDLLGKEEITERVYDKRKGYYYPVKKRVPMEELHVHETYAVESYHGGRNEQFWFGPCFEDDWTDWDLSSAYPTAMSLIGRPSWRAIRHTTDLADFTYDALAFALIDFRFPPDIRYPTMPVRTENGLVFPLTGTTFAPAPEIALARALGAEVKVRYGIVVPTDRRVPIFGPFIKQCLDHRNKAGKSTLEGLVWKEISNSTYGKTAQGLKRKRVYDMRERLTKILPESRITNPYFAAFITSFVRAVLGEIMNRIPRSSMVFSCTTDGFITNATQDEILTAQSGALVQLFAQARQELTGDPGVLEVKHRIRQPLGWRTRGQATLKHGLANDKGADYNIVLAKGGIFTPKYIETDAEENNYIVELFFQRTPDQVIEIEGLTGIRDIVEMEADLVAKLISKRLNMEFDWKRRPLGIGQDKKHGHLLFSTQPWHHVDQFKATRQTCDDYNSDERSCIKTMADFEHFATFLEVNVGLPKEHRRYLRRIDPDIKRLRMMICSAWKQGKAGFTEADQRCSASRFAALLTDLRIPCKPADVQNSLKRVFVEHSCPPTQAVQEALERLQKHFTSVQPAKFLCLQAVDVGVSIRPTTNQCPFVQRCVVRDRQLALAA